MQCDGRHDRGGDPGAALVPVFFVSVMRFFGRDDEAKADSAAVAEPHGPPPAE